MHYILRKTCKIVFRIPFSIDFNIGIWTYSKIALEVISFVTSWTHFLLRKIKSVWRPLIRNIISNNIILYKQTSSSITFGFFSFNNCVGKHFSRWRYTPTISFFFMTLNSEVCTVRFAPGHIRIRCSSRVDSFNCLIHPTGLLLYINDKIKNYTNKILKTHNIHNMM